MSCTSFIPCTFWQYLSFAWKLWKSKRNCSKKLDMLFSSRCNSVKIFMFSVVPCTLLSLRVSPNHPILYLSIVGPTLLRHNFLNHRKANVCVHFRENMQQTAERGHLQSQAYWTSRHAVPILHHRPPTQAQAGITQQQRQQWKWELLWSRALANMSMQVSRLGRLLLLPQWFWRGQPLEHCQNSGFSAAGPAVKTLAASWMSKIAIANGGKVAAGVFFKTYFTVLLLGMFFLWRQLPI